MDRYHPVPAPAPLKGAVPGRGLGIAGFVLSLLGAFAPIGLALSIVALVKARRVQRTNGLALGGIVIGGLGTLIFVIVTIAAIATLSTQTTLCGIDDLIALSCR